MHLRHLTRGALVTLTMLGTASITLAAPSPTIDGDIEDVLAFLADGTGCGLAVSDPTQEICKPDPLIVPCAPEVACDGFGGGTYFPNGFDLTLAVAAYDVANQVLYLGIRTVGNIGDSNGDLDPGNVCVLPGATVVDGPDISLQETYIWRFDTNCDQLEEFIIQVTADQVQAFGVIPSGTNFDFNGTELEVRISGISLPVNWGMHVFVGSTTDGLFEDTTGAFECSPSVDCTPVQTSAETWGRIKSIYR